ncbi:type I 3-dehydroquinate dehydratase [Vulcanisaeta thermophila]|uniref:type I 3-dehydroquinate dehydratase n=1 Tax=Vulcanisaeta thermophila TaxID=867917 RepID=UPI000852CB81|nr:type I 3-dehydroquinate dehydratase [Vulcanisaeta thermophila]
MMPWKQLLSRKPLLVCAYPVTSLSTPPVPSGCEAVELRLDYLDGLESRIEGVKEFIRHISSGCPTIVTIREPSEGGAQWVSEDVKWELLSFSKGLGALVDVEAELVMRDPRFRGLASDSIVSRHVFNEGVSVVNYLNGDLRLAREVGALVYKVFTVRDEDYPEMMKLLLMGGDDLNIAVIPMRPRFRAAAMFMGTALMYCSVGQGTAPGQLGIEECVRIKELIHRL